MAIPLPDDFSTYEPSDRQQPLPANVEDSFEKGLGARVQEALGNVVSYPGKIFAAATGAADKYTNALLGAQKQGNIAGVTFDNAGNAIKGLFEGFVGFVDISESGQAALVQDAALFERIGVNAQTSGKMLTTFTRNLDMSASGAMHMTKALSQMGDEIGVSAQKMMSDFEAAFKSLAVYGDQSIEVFQGLSAAAKAAGVEVATLTSIAGKFDTFQGAAEAVGKLNVLLGSQISSTEMLMMTEDQRIETLYNLV